MTYLKKFIISLFFFCLPFLLVGQGKMDVKDKESVLLLIHKLFDGMRAGDSAKVATVFHPDVTMYTSYTNKEGREKINIGELNRFLDAIGTPHDEVWDEKIMNTEILIDGGIAQVWTDYSFYIGEKFSHCGVDAFNLIYDPIKGWLIVSLMDTRRKKGCESEKS